MIPCSCMFSHDKVPLFLGFFGTFCGLQQHFWTAVCRVLCCSFYQCMNLSLLDSPSLTDFNVLLLTAKSLHATAPTPFSELLLLLLSSPFDPKTPCLRNAPPLSICADKTIGCIEVMPQHDEFSKEEN